MNRLSKSIEFDDVIILKMMKIRNCIHLGNKMKYGVEICHVEAAYDADFDMLLKCQSLGNEIKYEAEVW